MESNEASLSILMFPWLAHGHVFPYLELAKNLTKHNFTIFFCSTPIILQSLPLPHHLPITLIPLHLPSPPELPPDLHTTKHAPPHRMPLLRETFHASKAAFSAILASLRPDILIYDAFQPWAAEAAAKSEIPAVHFATTGAATYSFFYHPRLPPPPTSTSTPASWKPFWLLALISETATSSVRGFPTSRGPATSS
ncbi:UDP-glucosyltransferase 29-like [Salvia hispanica]|uniref:UDP-glucosyltransferase 29-like n=1 Tax=Salvia hispanica TaxID=49212 RepID=UPI0020091063|nr:UDP-glucosyltransferase 29-like [Salvia hispanica]